MRQNKPCIRQSFMQLHLTIMESSRDTLVEEELEDRREEKPNKIMEQVQFNKGCTQRMAKMLIHYRNPELVCRAHQVMQAAKEKAQKNCQRLCFYFRICGTGQSSKNEIEIKILSRRHKTLAPLCTCSCNLRSFHVNCFFDFFYGDNMLFCVPNYIQKLILV